MKRLVALVGCVFLLSCFALSFAQEAEDTMYPPSGDYDFDLEEYDEIEFSEEDVDEEGAGEGVVGGNLLVRIREPTDQAIDVVLVGPDGYYQVNEVEGEQVFEGLVPGVYSLFATDDELQPVFGVVEVSARRVAPVTLTMNRRFGTGEGAGAEAYEGYEGYGTYELGEYQEIEAEDTGNLLVLVQFAEMASAAVEGAAGEEEGAFEVQVSVIGLNDYRSNITTEGTLEDLEPGAYGVAATAEGYRMTQTVVEVRGGEAATVTLTLEPRERFGAAGLYGTFDVNGDSAVTADEFETGIFGLLAGGDDTASEDEFAAGIDTLYGGDFAYGFGDFDADADGVITEDEFLRVYDADLYTTWDADANGELAREELASGFFGRLDADNDGLVTAEEYEPYEPWFGYGYDELDADADGALAEDEFLGVF